MTKLMEPKTFTHTISDASKEKIPCSYEDVDLEVIIKIASNPLSQLYFNIEFKKIAKQLPFWAIISIRINEEEKKFFFHEEKQKAMKANYSSPFTKSVLKNGTKVTYNITQIPAYICQLKNERECICYLNSSIQLLFHLAKFRSLILSLNLNDKKSSWLCSLNSLFNVMCSYKSSASTNDLTESFGWPQLARHIPHDASEFIQKILEKIRDNLTEQKRKAFDEIFTSVYKSGDMVSTQQIINLFSYKVNLTDKGSSTDKGNSNDKGSSNSKGSSIDKGNLIDRIRDFMTGSKFIKLPDVLFLSLERFYPSRHQFPLRLDMKEFASDGKEHTYILSGMIILFSPPNSISHYRCFVRAHPLEIWHSFNDSVHTVYGWSYDSLYKTYKTPLEQEIKSTINNEHSRIRTFMYVREDAIKDYFCETLNNIPVRNPSVVNNRYSGPTRLIQITQTEDIKKYVEDGHTDFEHVGYSLEFEMSAKLTYRNVYEKVAESLNVPVNSFILRSATQSGAPSCLAFSCDNKQLCNFICYQIHLFYEKLENESKERLKGQSVPFYFLSFKFKPISFIRNVTTNVTHLQSSQSELRSVQPFRRKTPLKVKFGENQQGSIVEKNCFQYLTCIVLSTESRFETILSELNKELNLPENAKIRLYTAEYDQKQKIGYKELDVTKKIKDCVSQIMNGTYIYVQEYDDFGKTEEQKLTSFELLIEERIQTKFLFFKYLNKALNLNYFPKEIPNVFMLENMSIPVSFCKLTCPSVSKTMLLPYKIPLKSIDSLKRIICVAMNEKYPEKGLMQLFFGFRAGAPPFWEPLFGKTEIKSISNLLDFALKNTTVKLKTLSLSVASSSDSIGEMCSSNDVPDVDSDRDYDPNIFIHYHIFEEYNSETHIPIRIYFSKDAIKIDFISQILVLMESNVLDLAKNLVNILPPEKFAEDIQQLKNIFDKELNITDFYRIIRISDGKISNEMKLTTTFGSNFEVRFERIQNNFDKNDIRGYIPVFYGALYYNTKYVGSIGTPFYFPVLKTDLDDINIRDISTFEKSSAYQRLSSMIHDIKKGEQFKFYVTNYYGFIQNISYNELEIIINKNLNYCICIENLNASTFIDEYKFLSEIRILT